MRRWLLALILALMVLCMAVGLRAADIGWQEAVARLAQERTLAETCAGLLKTYGDEGAKSRGALSYAEAKAEYDAIIAGLDVALARKDSPTSLPDLQVRLQRGFDKREAFCTSVVSLVPPPVRGERGPITPPATLRPSRHLASLLGSLRANLFPLLQP